MVIVDLTSNSALKSLMNTSYTGDFGSYEGAVPGHGHTGTPNPNVNRDLPAGAGLLYRGGRKRQGRKSRGKHRHIPTGKRSKKTKRKLKGKRRSLKHKTRGKRSNRHTKKGGYNVQMNPANHPHPVVGPGTGHPEFNMGKNCGFNAPHKLGAGTQHGGGANLYNNPIGNTYYTTEMTPKNSYILRGSYPQVVGKANVSDCQGAMFSHQSGGLRVKRIPKYCNNPMNVESYSQVKPFWNKICPGSVSMYQTYLMPIKRRHPMKVLQIVRHYTAVFCHEIKALRQQKRQLIKNHHQRMKNILSKIQNQLKNIHVAQNSKAQELHKSIAHRHLTIVKDHLEKQSNRQTRRRNGNNSLRQSQKSNQKGGWHQYMGDWSRAYGYETVSNLSPQDSALAGTGLARAYISGGYGNHGNFTYDPMRNW
jgi:hypothetical protein